MQTIILEIFDFLKKYLFFGGEEDVGDIDI